VGEERRLEVLVGHFQQMDENEESERRRQEKLPSFSGRSSKT
jgi:hypothetical protein